MSLVLIAAVLAREAYRAPAGTPFWRPVVYLTAAACAAGLAVAGFRARHRRSSGGAVDTDDRPTPPVP